MPSGEKDIESPIATNRVPVQLTELWYPDPEESRKVQSTPSGEVRILGPTATNREPFEATDLSAPLGDASEDLPERAQTVPSVEVRIVP
jgi:hypothetical protein